MNLVDRNDIERWAERFGSKGNLPTLIARLVRATTPLSTQADFPSGSAAFVGGWDGVVYCHEDRAYTPKGVSLWEFGTEKDCKGKADDDYDKRSKDPLDFDPSQCTFVFVTPRFWKQKNKWKAEKLKDNKWKDVRVYDSVDIEQWMDSAAAVSRWFSSHVAKYPSDGIITIEEFWKEWALGPMGELLPGVITSGRETEVEQLLTFLNSPPNIKGVRATSKDEAIAFIIASAKQFEEQHKETFFSKSLVIDSPANFRSVRINTNSLNLIAKFEEPQIMFAAAAEGHHVLVPLGPDDTFNQEIITLPSIDKHGQIASLVSMGLSDDEAAKYSKEAARNITVLKRLLKFSQNNLKWLRTQDVREIIPAMLLGRWNENNRGDREILEKLAGEKYENYAVKLNKWRNIEESPLIQIGEMWRLTSPLDLWTNVSQFLMKRDFELLQEVFMLAFKSGNPYVEQDSKGSQIPNFFRRERYFSGWAREGLAQSLILIAVYGEGLRIPNMPTPQLWVDGIIRSLLFKADGSLWASLDHELPLISEASPHSFFDAAFESLSQASPPLMEMFVEENGLISQTSNHTGLLWGLEGLAWMPEHLFNASYILLILSRLDPGGNLANRPFNSIREIFKPWHFQTLASYEERMDVLKQITQKEKEFGWDLLISMLPKHHGIAHPTHKMRWRMFNESFNISYTYQEIWETHAYVVDLLISNFDNSEDNFSLLFEESVTLSSKDRRKILDFADSVYLKVAQNSFITWNTIRKILSKHRSHPGAEWALSEKELQRYELLYHKLSPNDTVKKYIWLFDESWPQFPGGFDYEDDEKYDKQQLRINNARFEGVKIILEQHGIERIKKLSFEVKESWALGDALAKIVDENAQIFSIAELLNNDKNNLRFVHGFFFRKSLIEGMDWIFNLYKQLKSIAFNNKALAQLFVPLNQSKTLWSFIDQIDEETKSEYWLSIYPSFYHVSRDEKINGLSYLLQYNRTISAINICSHFSDDIPSTIIVNILQKAATEQNSDDMQFREYEVEKLFATLDKRDDVEHNTLLLLEWLYLPILTSYGTRRNPKVLNEELKNNPEFFVEVLKWVYMPKNKELTETEQRDLSDEMILNRANQAYQLLHSWKDIPGVDEDDNIDNEFLNSWVDTARKLAEQADRLEVADAQIGQVLAQYPEKGLSWPPSAICEVIERVNTNSLKSNFSSATFNKRGSSVRGPYDGGNIERGHAEYFQNLASKHRNTYPVVATILANLSKGYLEDAKRMDESAERDKLDY